MTSLRERRSGRLPDTLPRQWPAPTFGAPTAPVRRVLVDAGPFLAVVMLSAYLLPPRLVVSGLGAAGRPVMILGFVLLMWWLATRAVPGLATYGRQPVRVTIGVFLVAYLLSYIAGYRRVLDAVESSSADRGLLVTFALIGIALATADGISTRAGLDRLLKRLLLAGMGMAFVGHVQALAGIDLTRYIRPPGLSLNAPPIGLGARGVGDAFTRVAGTSGHYIEYGVLLAMLLPLAIHYAFFARTTGERQWRWFVVLFLGAGIPFSISRSAIVALGVGLVTLFLAWTLRRQFNALLALVILTVGFRVVQPGLLGTLRSLFANVENDPSIQNRTADYAVVWEYVVVRPWLGIGQGTALPERTLLLDNQFLGTVLAGGLIGLSALILLFAVPFCLARRIRRNGADEETRHLGQALAALVVVATVSSFTFDSMAFSTFAATFYLAVGAIGALWRLDRTDPPVAPFSPVRPLLRSPHHTTDRPT